MDQVEKKFKQWDKDSDGRLTQEEVVALVGGDYRPALIEKLMKEGDTDADGSISVEEFKKCVFGV